MSDDLFKLHRKNDRATSVAAAASILPEITERQAEVMAYARQHPEGFTDLQMMQALGTVGVSTHRTRRAELTEKGLIVDTGKTLKHPGRRTPHTIWRAT